MFGDCRKLRTRLIYDEGGDENKWSHRYCFLGYHYQDNNSLWLHKNCQQTTATYKYKGQSSYRGKMSYYNLHHRIDQDHEL